MMPGNPQPFFSRSWMVALLIGLLFVGVEYGLKLEIEGADAPRSRLDLGLLLCGYLFMFCLKPIQKVVQRKLCPRIIRKTVQGMRSDRTDPATSEAGRTR